MTLKASTNKVKFVKPALLFLLAVIVFFALRLPFLTKIPVFVDEAIYIRWSQIMRNEPSLRFLPLSDGKQPLFMWATMPALKIISDPLIAGRAISILAGLISLTGLVVFVYVLFGNLFIAALAGLLYAALPFSIFFDRLALVDSLLSSFGLWSLALGAMLIKKPRLDLALLLGFSLGFGLLTKSPAVFFYLWQPLLFFTLAPVIKTRKNLKLLGCWLIAFIISQAMYAILRLGTNFHLVGSRNADYVFSFGEVLRHPLNPLLGNLKTTISWLWYLLTPPLVIAALFAFFSKEKRKVLDLFLISLLPLLAQASVAKVYTSRYILFAAIPLLAVTAIGLLEISRHFKIKKWLVVFLFMLWPVILSLILIISPQKANMPFDMRSGYLEEWTAGHGQKEVANYLIAKARLGETIVVGTDGFFGTLPDGLQIYTQSTPNITVIGGAPNISSLPESLTNSLKDKNNTVYLVANASRIHLPPSQLARMQFIAQYPKPNRLDGSHESLLFYRLIR